MAGTQINAPDKDMAGSTSNVVRGQFNVLVGNVDTNVTAMAALVTLVNQLRRQALYDVYGNPGLVIDTNFDVKNATAFFYSNNGTLLTQAANGSWDTGTTKTITANLWMSALLTITSGAARVVTYAAAASYASEALAIAALPTAPNATDTIVGYVTIQAGASTWTAGTSALAGGTGGTPAATTNYYNNVNGNAASIGAAASVPVASTASQVGDIVGNLT